ncbi:type I DNA topoisomerase [Deltaproteobacteria bacterium TL4]
MAKSLVVVESPAKAKTINKYLGKQYIVKASIGHVKDLPKDELGVDIENDFAPKYEVMPDKNKVIKELRKDAKSVESIYLASDPDREGEAIAAHLAEELQKNFKGPIHRVLLYEITKKSILETFENPGQINQNKYEAQKARRVLDRLVGYQISPLLWEKVRFGLSAGRVQSVAVRIICEREQKIQAFKPEEYWYIHSLLNPEGRKEIRVKLFKSQGKVLKITDEESATKLVNEAMQADFIVKTVTKKQRLRHPVAPFTTSTLQQEASRKFGFSSSRTMQIAQQLYEGVNEEVGGLITYMRTDSIRISEVALRELLDSIALVYGEAYLPEKPRLYKSNKVSKVQDAHEAIRPTSMKYPPNQTKHVLDHDQQRLYTLIWNRFVSSQMASAVYDQTQVDIESGKLIWRISGSVLVFPGFLDVYSEGKDDTSADEDEEEFLLPPLKEGETLQLKAIQPSQHFTEPPPRYSSATLIKELEEQGIGRPSTFASIMNTIEKRLYVENINKRYFPTPIGTLVNSLLVNSFPDILDVGFTAQFENTLDGVEEGTANWTETIRQFYGKFSQDLKTAHTEMPDVKKQEIPTDLTCHNCNSPMVIKWGKNGEFLACSNYPDCKTTSEFKLNEEGKPEPVSLGETDQKCDKCGNPLMIKKGKFGQFLACSDYPKCKNTKPLEEDEQQQPHQKVEGTCELCGLGLVKRVGRFGPFTSCENYPECKYIQKNRVDTKIICPECSKGNLLERRSRKGKTFYSCSNYPKCKFAMWDKPVNQPCPQCGFTTLGEKQTKREHLLKCPNPECNFTEPLFIQQENSA